MTKTFLILFISVLALTGCAAKIEKEYVYKDVYIPIKCNSIMPIKPINDSSFEAHKKKMIYFLQIEDLYKKCIGLQDEK